MSKNLDLMEKLAAQRERAKTDAEARTPKLPPPSENTEPSQAVAQIPKVRQTPRPRAKSLPVRRSQTGERTAGQGTLERTTITLKAQDRSVLGKAQAFFIGNGVKAPPASTLIRLALLNLGETLDAKPERVQRIFEQIRSEDGRRNPAKT